MNLIETQAIFPMVIMCLLCPRMCSRLGIETQKEGTAFVLSRSVLLSLGLVEY